MKVRQALSSTATFVRVLVLLALMVPRVTAAAGANRGEYTEQGVLTVPAAQAALTAPPATSQVSTAIDLHGEEQPVHSVPAVFMAKTKPAAFLLPATSTITATAQAMSAEVLPFTPPVGFGPKKSVPYLILKKNGSLTPPISRTLEIDVSNIEVPPGGVTITLQVETQHLDPDGGSAATTLPGWRESQVISNTGTTPLVGRSLSFTHEFTDTVMQGATPIPTPTDYFQYTIRANSVKQFTIPYAFLMENQDEDVLADGYSASVSYCDMFPFDRGNLPPRKLRSKVHDHIANEMLPMMRDVYNTEVHTWGFGPLNRDFDHDKVVEVFVGGGLEEFHGQFGQFSWDDSNQRKIALISNVNNYRYPNPYPDLVDGEKALFGHEFFHGVQDSVKLDIGGNHGTYWNAIIEGQAKFVESVIAPPTATAPGTEFITQHEYFATDFGANGFLNDLLNSSYRDINGDMWTGGGVSAYVYRMAIYWRFLFEQSNGLNNELQGMNIIHRVLEEMNTSTRSKDIVDSFGPLMDTAFTANGGPFPSHKESLLAFAHANYALSLNSGRCGATSGPACAVGAPYRYYDPNALYATPKIAPAPTYAGGVAPAFTGQITASFGMDFIQIPLNTTVITSPPTLEFFGDRGAAATFDVQLWKLSSAGGGFTSVAGPFAFKDRNVKGNLTFVLTDTSPLSYDTLGLVIVRTDKDESKDPVGNYHINLSNDDDGDGIPNSVECSPTCQDSDNDGLLDYQDPDDDGDGIDTKIECSNFKAPGTSACPDTDGDGKLNYQDGDDDNDGFDTRYECPAGPPCPDRNPKTPEPDYLDRGSHPPGNPGPGICLTCFVPGFRSGVERGLWILRNIPGVSGDPPVPDMVVARFIPPSDGQIISGVVSTSPYTTTSSFKGELGAPFVTLTADSQVRWSPTTQSALELTNLTTANATVYDSTGALVGTGSIQVTPQLSSTIALVQGAPLQVALTGTGATSYYAPAISGLGAGGNWEAYTARLTSTQPYTLTLENSVVTINGNSTYTGSFMLVVHSPAAVQGQGHTAVPSFAQSASIQAQQARLNIGPASGTLMLGNQPIDATNGLALAGYTGPITITETTDTTDRVELTGDASFFTMKTSPANTTTNPNTPVHFQAAIDANFTDTYTTTVEAPEGWNVELDATGEVTATPPLGAAPGDYTILVTAQSAQYPDLFVSAKHTVTITPFQGMTMRVAPDLLITVPWGQADPNALPGTTNNGQVQVPGAAYTINITNTSTTEHTFNVAVSGLPAGWTILSGAEGQTNTTLTLPAGGVGQLGLYISPTTATLPTAGTSYSFAVDVAAADDPSLAQHDSATFVVPAIAFSRVSAAPAVVYSSPGGSTSFDVGLRNVGNTRDSFPLSITQPIDSWTASVDSPLALDAGQVVTQSVTLQTPDGELGRDYPVTIQAPTGAYTQTTSVLVHLVSPAVLDVYQAAQSTAQLFPKETSLPTALQYLGLAIEELETACQNVTTLAPADQAACSTTMRDHVVSAAQAVATHAGAVSPLISANTTVESIAQAMQGHTAWSAIASDLAELRAAVVALRAELSDVGQHGASAWFTPGMRVAMDDKPATFNLNVTNRGQLATTYAITLTSSSATLLVWPYTVQRTLQPGESAVISATVMPTEQGVFTVQASIAAVEATHMAPLRAQAAVRAVDALLGITGVSAAPAFVEYSGDVKPAIYAQIANVANEPISGTARVQLFAADGGRVADTTQPLQIASSLTPVSYQVAQISTTGLVTGTYRVAVDILDDAGQIIPKASGQGMLAVGQAVHGGSEVIPSVVAPGTITVTTQITTELDPAVIPPTSSRPSEQTNASISSGGMRIGGLMAAMFLPSAPLIDLLAAPLDLRATTTLTTTVPPDLVVRSNTTLPAGVYTYTHVLVTDNSTLTLKGDPSTGAGVTLVAEDVRVDAGARIAADGQGYAGTYQTGSGPGGGGGYNCCGRAGGGGGYGGLGGNAYYSGGQAYGSVSQPSDLGSAGGGGDYYGGRLGGAGGGAIHLVVRNTIQVDGVLSVNGAAGDYRTGGGSGGSLWIEAQTLAGSGQIQANGGGSPCCTGGDGGGGSGGHIALYYTSSSLPLTVGHMQAYGGSGSQYGGPGTIFLQQADADPHGILWIHNRSEATQPSVLYGAAGSLVTFDQVIVEANATLRLVPVNTGDSDYTNDAPFELHANKLSIGATGKISTDGQGYAGTYQIGSGPGGGGGYNCCGRAGGGGGYGGLGGNAYYSGGQAYGSVSQPADLGSAGGGGDYYGGRVGGAGGGAIHLVVSDTLTVDGVLSANGADGDYRTGGGSGGSLWVTVGTLAGSGLIAANGGGSLCCTGADGGGGSGGRIALYYTTNAFPIAADHLQSYGGKGSQYGGPGTIFLQQAAADPHGVLWVHNRSETTQPSILYGTAGSVVTFDQVIVEDNATLRLVPFTDPSTGAVTPFTLYANKLSIGATGKISTDGQGYAGTYQTGNGPGGGGGYNCCGRAGGGGGYGGLGGNAYYSGGSAYGSVSQPADLGSAGGGGDYYGGRVGGAGGGAIHLVVSDTLTVDGVLSANGADGDYRTGGGSGGSLWVNAGTLAGSGLIAANGGGSLCCTGADGGGGSGGRIALYYTSSSLPLTAAHVQAYGGSGQQYGGPGTIFLQQAAADPHGVLWVHNRSEATQPAVFSAVTNGVMTFDQVIVEDNATLRLVPLNTGDSDYTNDAPFVLRANNITIGATGKISTDGQGYAGTYKTGNGPGGGGGYNCCGRAGGGGGYGGLGGNAYYSGGSAYGSVSQPADLGSAGGGGDYYGGRVGGAGGGAIQLIVTDTLRVDGVLSANGANGDYRTGGGSGGSLWVNAGTLAGSGLIAANGGASACCTGADGGGGSGGRIALYYGGSLPASLTVQVNGGSGANAGGVGSVYRNSVAVDPSFSTVTVAPSEVVANGVATATITVTLKDENGNPKADKPVAVGIASGDQVTINGQVAVAQTMLVDIGRSNANGVATATISTTRAGQRVLFARSGVETIQDQATITFIAGPPDAATSHVTVARATAPADGSTPVVVDVTVRDAFDNPVPGATVIILATGATEIIQPDGLTDAAGHAAGQIRSAQDGPVIVSAVAAGVSIAQTAPLTFVGPDLALTLTGPSAVVIGRPITYTLTVANTGLVTAQSIVVSDTLPSGVSFLSATAPVTPTQDGARLTWQLGPLAPGERVTFQLSGQVAATAPGGTAITNQAAATTTSPEARRDDNHADATTTLIGAVDPATSRLTADQTTIVANGVDAATVTATLLDAHGQAVPGVALRIQATGSISVTQSASTTDNQGQVQATIRSTTVQTTTLTALDAAGEPLVAQPLELAFVAGPPDAAHSTITISPTTLVANGVDTATVDALLRDAQGHPLAGRAVELALTGGGNTITPTLATADLDGRVVFQLTSTQAETKTIALRDRRTGATLDAGQVRFVHGPVDPSRSTITADSSSAPADGASLLRITAQLRDATGNPVPDATVTFTADTANVSLTQPSAPSDAAGQATATIASSTYGSVVVRARAGDVPLAASVALRFVGPDLTVSANGPQIGIAEHEVTYTLTLRNTGLATAHAVELTDDLPDGITFVRQTGTFSLMQTNASLAWQLGDVAAGQTIEFQVVGLVQPGTSLDAQLGNGVHATTATPEEYLSNNTAITTLTVAPGYGTKATLTPADQRVALGGQATYDIVVENTGNLPQTYQLQQAGLDQSWYTIQPAALTLAPGAVGHATLTVQVDDCAAAGDYQFAIRVAAAEAGRTQTLIGTLSLLTAPQITNLAPADGAGIGATQALFTWQTAVSGTTTLYLRPANATDFQAYSGDAGTLHQVSVSGLSRNTDYQWYVNTVSACGSEDSPVRTLHVLNGIIFNQRDYTFNVERDYNQLVTLTVQNQDVIAHTLVVTIENPYPELIVGFVDDGSSDHPITLAPGEQRNITLGVHTQDVTQRAFDLVARLTADDGAAKPIQDAVPVHVNVHIPNVDFSITQVSQDPQTLVTTYRVDNHGDPLTDLAVTADVTGTGSVYLLPGMSHGRLESGQSFTFEAIPAVDTDFSALSGSIRATAVGVTRSVPINLQLPDGARMYLGEARDVSLEAGVADWYCTNRPIIDNKIILPPGFRREDVQSAKFLFQINSAWSSVRPHDVDIFLNGNEIGALRNLIPQGLYTFPVDPAFLNESAYGPAVNNLRLVTTHMNGGHYVVASNMQLSLCLNAYREWVAAPSQNAANQVVSARSFLIPAPKTLDVELLQPAQGQALVVGVPTTVVARISDDIGRPWSYEVTMQADNGNGGVILYDDGAHGDGGYRDGVYAGSWTPLYAGPTALTVHASSCTISGEAQRSVAVQNTNYAVTIAHNVPITGTTVLTNTIVPPPDTLSDTGADRQLTWQHTLTAAHPAQQDQLVTQLDDMRPGEVRQVASSTVISYTGASGSGQIVLGPQSVAAAHLIAITPAERMVGQGGQTVYQIELANPTAAPTTLTLDVAGLPSDWVAGLHPITLSAGEHTTLPLTVTAPLENVEAGVPILGTHPFAVLAQTDHGGLDQAGASLTVTDLLDVQIAPPQAIGTGGQVVTYTVSISNHESVDQTYTLTTEGLVPNAVALPTSVQVAAGTTVTVPLEVTIFADRGPHPFTVRATPAGSASAGTADAVLSVTGDRQVAAALSPAQGTGGPGTPAIYQLHVTNTGSMADTYTFSMDLPAGWTWRLEANGAPIDSLTLTPYVFNAADLSLIVTPAVNATTGSTEIELTTRSANNPSVRAVAPATLMVTKYGVQVAIAPPHATVDPTSGGTWQVTVTNTGSVADSYTLSASGVVSMAAQLSPSVISLAPGQSQTAQLSVGALPFVLAQTYPFAVTARSLAEPAIQNYSAADVTFSGYQAAQVSILPASQTLTDTPQASYLMVITNTGNLDASFALNASAAPSGLDVALEVPEVYIPAHMTAGILVTAHGHQPGTYQISLQAASTTAPASASNTATLVIEASAFAPPTVSAGGPYHVVEGDTVLLTASGNTSSGALSFAWDLDGDGTFETPGQSVSFSAADRNGPSTPTVAVQATDSLGRTATDQVTIAVENASPTASLSNSGPVDEGSPVTIQFAEQHDPSAADMAAGLHYAFACDGGSLEQATYATTGTGTAATCSFDDGPSIHVIRARIIDKNDGYSEYTTSVQVTNANPTASLSNSGPVDEGSPVTIRFADQRDPSAADTAAGFHYAFACDGAALDGATYAGSGADPTATCTFDDSQGDHIVWARIIDKDGGYAENTTTVQVMNVNPTASLSNSGPVAEGSPATIQFAEQHDPSAADTAAGFHYAFACDGGALDGASYAGSGADAAATCTFDDGPSSHTVRARIIDKDDGYSEYTTTVQVMNANPTASLSNDGPVGEGTPVTISFVNQRDPSAADAAGFHYAFACDGGALDGASYAGSGADAAATCTFDDGPSTHTVRARIIDKDGGYSEYTTTVQIQNVSPIASLSSNGPVREGSPATIQFIDPHDPSAADTAAGFHYAFACDGSAFDSATYAKSGTEMTTTCTFSDNLSHTVRARIFDRDGGYTEYTTVVQVDNENPTASLSNSGPIAEGSPVTIGFAEPRDASVEDTAAGFHYAFACDGAALDGVTYAKSGTEMSTTCTFDDGPSSHTVRARIIDKDDGYSEYTTIVQVDNANPAARFSGPATAVEGSAITLTLDLATDASTADTAAGFRYAFDCGTGYGPLSDSATVSCIALDNPNQPVSAKIVDKDGGVSEYRGVVQVTNANPTASLSNNGPVGEGSPATIRFSGQFDPSTADTAAGFHYAFACDDAALDSATYATSGASATASCTFDDGPSTHTVRARIIDKDGGYSEYTTSVQVENSNPTARFTTPATVAEGRVLPLALDLPTDPSSADRAAGFRYAFDCGGGYGALSSSATASCTFDDGPRTQTVRAKLVDKDGGVTEYSATVQVTNANPTASLSNDGPVMMSSPLTIRFTNPRDPSAADTAAGFHYAFACDGAALDNVTYAKSGTSAAVSCSFAESPGTHIIRARIIDKDDGYTEYTTTAQVNAEIYPIALSSSTLSGVAAGTAIQDILNGAGNGNFGWLTWTGQQSDGVLARSLTPPGDSATYTNPDNASDHQVSTGDWVFGRTGINNSSGVRDALEQLKGRTIVVPVWDQASGQGANLRYHIVGFAVVQLTDYQLSSENRITVLYKGMVSAMP